MWSGSSPFRASSSSSRGSETGEANRQPPGPVGDGLAHARWCRTRSPRGGHGGPFPAAPEPGSPLRPSGAPRRIRLGTQADQSDPDLTQKIGQNHSQTRPTSAAARQLVRAPRQPAGAPHHPSCAGRAARCGALPHLIRWSSRRTVAELTIDSVPVPDRGRRPPPRVSREPAQRRLHMPQAAPRPQRPR